MRVFTTFDWEGPEVPENLDSPTWLLNDVAAATGVNLAVLKAWLSRNPVVVRLGPYDYAAHGKGSARVFTLRRVLAVSITAELVRLGISPSRAGELATTFMDGFIRGEVRKKGKIRRMGYLENLSYPQTEVARHRLKSKGLHWRLRETVLVAYPDTEVLWITNKDDNLYSINKAAGSNSAAAVVLFYDSIIERVCSRLNEVAQTRQHEKGGA